MLLDSLCLAGYQWHPGESGMGNYTIVREYSGGTCSSDEHSFDDDASAIEHAAGSAAGTSVQVWLDDTVISCFDHPVA